MIPDARPTRSNSSFKEPIAIIGSAELFVGGVNGLSKLWDLLHSPRDVRNEISDDAFNARGYYHTNPAQHGRSNIIYSYLVSYIQALCCDIVYLLTTAINLPD